EIIKVGITWKANLTRANFSRADLREANLREAILIEVDLSKANLYQSKGLKYEQLLAAKTLYKIKGLSLDLVKKLKNIKPELFEEPKGTRQTRSDLDNGNQL
ncbi:MAG: pentapeptide repeat-containing protein, partial [Candidatus Aminicenantes bacterium]|nr:pentapeptide repeat-containing protein [Candidatus Aminicenantes bacterium]